MKAILKFDLTEPSDRIEHMRCLKSLDMSIVLFEYTVYLRRYIDHPDTTPQTRDAFEQAQEALNEILEGNGVDIDELIE